MILPSISCLNNGDLSGFQMIISLSTEHDSLYCVFSVEFRTFLSLHGPCFLPQRTNSSNFIIKLRVYPILKKIEWFLSIIFHRALLPAWFSFYLLLMEIVSKLNHKLHPARIKELNGNGNTSKCLSSALYLKLRPDVEEILQKHLKVLENSNLYRNGLFRLIPGIKKQMNLTSASFKIFLQISSFFLFLLNLVWKLSPADFPGEATKLHRN